MAVQMGALLGIAADCNLPTAPIEVAMDRLLKKTATGEMEGTRLKQKMMAASLVYRNARKQNEQRHPTDCSGVTAASQQESLNKLPWMH
jgi:hypothetical protein